MGSIEMPITSWGHGAELTVDPHKSILSEDEHDAPRTDAMDCIPCTDIS